MTFTTLIPSSTDMDRRIAFQVMIRQAEIEAINGVRCLHRDPETGMLHTSHASSTGIFRARWF